MMSNTVVEEKGCSHIPWLLRVYAYCILWWHLWSFTHHGTS